MARLITFLQPILLGMIVALGSCGLRASGPTGEEEALAAHNSGRYPLTLSADSRWILHVDAGNVLHRKRVGDEKTYDSFDLEEPVQTLSASRSGKKVAYVTSKGCVGVVMFSETTSRSASALERAPSQIWLDRSLIDPNPNAGRCPATTSKEDSNGPVYGAFAVALSADGTRIAVAGSTIKVIEVTSRRLVHEMPTGNATVLHMRFVDADRKLLVVQALLGEQWEAPATGSDMQFAIWDLQTKDLFNFHNTQTVGALTSYDFLWSFSETTGDLWAISTNGRYWEGDPKHPRGQRRALVRPHTRNIMRCAEPNRPALPLPSGKGDGWLGFAADPLGRYVAGVTPTFNEKIKRATSTLWLRDTRTGKLLSEWRLNDELRSLATSSDGRFLFGITAGQPNADELAFTRYAWSFTGGGKLMKFDLSQKLAALPPIAATSWSEQRCRIEDEEEHARDIVVSTEAMRPIFEIRLGDYHRRLNCLGHDLSQIDGVIPRVWGQLDDGSLFVDGGDVLEKIDALSGKILQQFPTPRTASVCSLPIYEKRQFLSWQGDTITVRPFAEKLVPADRKVLVRKPGWIATGTVFLGNRFRVIWISSRYANGQIEQDEGSAVAIEYDMSGKELKQTLGRAVDGAAVFASEDEDGDRSMLFSGNTAARPPQGSYRWERSYLGSVRAYRRNESAGTYSTVLWAGLRLAKERSPSSSPESDIGNRTDSWVARLDGSLGANVGPTAITIYDADKRLQVGQISAQDVRRVALNPIDRVLVVESGDPAYHPTLWKLTAYRIE